MEQREGHLHQRIEITEGQRISIESDRPIRLEFLDDATYANFHTTTGRSGFEELTEFPATINTPGQGFWNVVIRHSPEDAPHVLVQVADY